MRTLLITLFLILCKGNVHSTELPAEKEDKWQIQFNYDKLYNYRYAKISENAFLNSLDHSFMLAQAAYIDTGHIATYTNQLGLMIQRKIWKFIHLQTGFTFSRRGYLGTYVKHNQTPFKTIELLPRKVIFFPMFILFSFKIKEKLIFELGMGVERRIFTISEFLNQDSQLDTHSKGFFGYQLDKTRMLDSKTTVINKSAGLSGINYGIVAKVGFKLTKRFDISINGNYSVQPKYFKVDTRSSDQSLNYSYIYESKPYILGIGTGIAYSF